MRDYYIDHIYMVWISLLVKLVIIYSVRQVLVVLTAPSQASSAGYSNRYARTKLARAAEAAGLEYRGISNIASTYYGPPAVVSV
jgi:uncharacterized protein HemY